MPRHTLRLAAGALALALLAAAPARADEGEVHVVRAGDTVESIAAGLGDASLADTIRADNGLAPGAQPRPGDVLALPDTGAIAQPGQVLSLTGTGTLTPPGGTPVPLVEGAFLIVGTRVCTAEASYAAVRLAAVPDCTDEDDVTLLPGTCLVLDSNTSRPDRRRSVVSVESGSVSVRSNAGEGQVAVRTATGLTTGDDGGFRVAVEEASTRTEAVFGDVAVIGSGQEKEVPSGFGVRTPEGQAPGELVELLPPGTPTAPAPDARLLIPDFAWTPVPRALGYRIELATDAQSVRLIRRTEVGQPAWTPTQLFLPYDVEVLYWRIVPFDRLGFEGIPSTPRPVRFPSGVR